MYSQNSFVIQTKRCQLRCFRFCQIFLTGNILRIFERGGEAQLTLGLPTQDEEPGRPSRRLSDRGLGTLNRTDPVFLGTRPEMLAAHRFYEKHGFVRIEESELSPSFPRMRLDSIFYRFDMP